MSDLRIGAMTLEHARPGDPLTVSRFYIQSEHQLKGAGYTKRPVRMYWADHFPLDLNMYGTEHWAQVRNMLESLRRNYPERKFRVIERTATVATEVVEGAEDPDRDPAVKIAAE